MNLGRITLKKHTGNEAIHSDGKIFPHKLLSFWQWSCSDILGNVLRGVLAEYIVLSDLGDTSGVRQEWDAYDILMDNDIKIEVKSSSYLQSWSQSELSIISFNIQPTYGWDAATNTQSTVLKRQADAYVFCILSHKNKLTVDPLNMKHWEFYVLATKALDKKNPKQKSIRLSSLLSLKPVRCEYGDIRQSIESVLKLS